MRLFAVTLASLGLASAAAVNSKVNYDGFKVYRVTVGEDRAKLSSVVDSLKLATWKGKVATSKVVDVVVPPSQISEFEASTEGLSTKVMHNDLGTSIQGEETFEVYGGVSGKYHPSPE